MTSEKDISSAMLGAGVSTMGGGSAFPPALSTAIAGSEPRKIEDVLASEGFYMGPPAGVSMWPMLRNRHDVMLVVPAKGELRRYDVALYRRGGKYVLHRVVGHFDRGSEKGYVICGDNCVTLEYIPCVDVLGVLRTAHGGRDAFGRSVREEAAVCLINRSARPITVRIPVQDVGFDLLVGASGDNVREQEGAASIATAAISIAKPPAATMRIRSCGWRCSPCARYARAQMPP